jgi:aspartyl/asparaginyl-tRNA synthetase
VYRAGFGLGLGRLLMILLGLESLREATFLFRRYCNGT